ncbi:MAG: TatD family hydrolase [Alistipes sp.]|nr:TatD family hydrolase [Alistipes sp.]
MSFNYVDIHTHNPREGILSPRMTGIHPWHAERGAELPDFAVCDIIGETGLDYAVEVDRAAQMRLFREHLVAATKLDKPVVLHVVKSFEDVMVTLRDYPTLRGVVFHGFVGSVEQAKRCFARGYYLSFGARSLRSPRTREVIALTPEGLLFAETDDSTEPTIEEVYDEVAAIRGESIAGLKQTIEENYKVLFRNDR